VVAVEYFTLWIDAKPLVNTAPGLKRFFWQNIICRFGVPRKITVNNAKQFEYIQGLLPLDGCQNSFCISISPAVQLSNGKGECTDIRSYKKDTRELAKR
jgi:hypothetical protein